MRFSASLLLLSFLIPQDPVTFRVKADYIKVPVTVFDPQGRLIPDLTREQFRLLDEGEPRAIDNFLRAQAPVSVALLLDVSGSIQEEIEEIKKAALRFSSAFGREDQISVIAFSDKVEVLQDWTNRQNRIKKSLKRLKPGYRTALYDALLQTASEALGRVDGRKVIILLTDGLDNESYANYDEVVNRLSRLDVALYIVSRTRLVMPKVERSGRVEFLNKVMKQVLNEKDTNFVDVYFREKETAMRNLAESTGGRVFFPEQLTELSSSYEQVARELKNQYVLTFRPPRVSGKSFRRIEVECSGPIGRIYFRQQYHWVSETDAKQ